MVFQAPVAMGTRPPEDRETMASASAGSEGTWQWELDPLKIESDGAIA